MRKLGKKNQITDESVEAFFCFCVVCACNCYCSYHPAKYNSEMRSKYSKSENIRSSNYR